MEGYEQIEADGVEVAVQHDPEDNAAMLSLSTAPGLIMVWLTPEQTAEVIAMLQRMHARQVVGGDGVPVPDECAALSLLTKDLTATADDKRRAE